SAGLARAHTRPLTRSPLPFVNELLREGSCSGGSVEIHSRTVEILSRIPLSARSSTEWKLSRTEGYPYVRDPVGIPRARACARSRGRAGAPCPGRSACGLVLREHTLRRPPPVRGERVEPLRRLGLRDGGAAPVLRQAA